MNFRTIVSTHVDDSGAPDQGEWRDAKVGIPNEVMIYGTTLNGNNKTMPGTTLVMKIVNCHLCD